jgi:hypothetical protein
MRSTATLIVLLLAIAAASCSAPSPANGPIQDGPIASPSPDSSAPAPDLPDMGNAPELVNEVWLNADAPLRLSDLGGRVVLLDFWTFG